MIFGKNKKRFRPQPEALFATVFIPYQELLGNYNPYEHMVSLQQFIPYQELLGNYNSY